MKRIFTAILSLALVSACFVSCQPDEPAAVEKELGATTVQFLNTKNPEVFYALGESKTYTLEHVISGIVEGTEPSVEAPNGWTVVYEVAKDVATVTVTAPADNNGANSGAVVIKGKDNIEREATATLNVLRREPDAVAFGSEAFREHLAANYDTDNNGSLSMAELQAITVLDIRGEELTPNFRYEGLGITSLAGIENLTGLTELYISNNNIGSVDLSKNTELKVLHACFNGLTSIDLSKNTKIEEFYCFHNNLSTLNLNAQSKLTTLDCQNNKLESILFANGVKLTSLNISKNQFATFDATKHADLTSFNFSNNMLTAIDMTACSKLESLNGENNLLESIDLSSISKATIINLVNNKLASVDVSACAALVELYASNNDIETLDLGGCTNLESVNVENNALTSIAMTGLDKLSVLVCGNNQLATIDLAGCPNIERLIANNNKMTTIDLSGAKALTYAKVYDNPFESVNVKGLANLDYLGLVNYDTNADRYGEGNIRVVRDDKGTAQKDEQGNVLRRFYFAGLKNAKLDLDLNGLGITELYVIANPNLVELNIAKCTEITVLEAYENKLASIDLSANTALTSVNISKNNIEKVDVTGMENLVTLNVSGMSSLNSLVLNGVTKTLQNLYIVKATTNSIAWTNNGGTLTITGSTLKNLALDIENSDIKTLKIYNNANLMDLNLSKCSQVTELQAYANSFNTIDVSACTELATLDCSDNTSLSSIDLSQNTKLLSLKINNNRMGSLNLDAQEKLTKLEVKGTYLSGTLDLSKCVALADAKSKVDCTNNPGLSEVILPAGADAKICTADEKVTVTIAE